MIPRTVQNTAQSLKLETSKVAQVCFASPLLAAGTLKLRVPCLQPECSNHLLHLLHQKLAEALLVEEGEVHCLWDDSLLQAALSLAVPWREKGEPI